MIRLLRMTMAGVGLVLALVGVALADNCADRTDCSAVPGNATTLTGVASAMTALVGAAASPVFRRLAEAARKIPKAKPKPRPKPGPPRRWVIGPFLRGRVRFRFLADLPSVVTRRIRQIRPPWPVRAIKTKSPDVEKQRKQKKKEQKGPPPIKR